MIAVPAVPGIYWELKGLSLLHILSSIASVSGFTVPQARPQEEEEDDGSD